MPLQRDGSPRKFTYGVRRFSNLCPTCRQWHARLSCGRQKLALLPMTAAARPRSSWLKDDCRRFGMDGFMRYFCSHCSDAWKLGQDVAIEYDAARDELKIVANTKQGSDVSATQSDADHQCCYCRPPRRARPRRAAAAVRRPRQARHTPSNSSASGGASASARPRRETAAAAAPQPRRARPCRATAAAAVAGLTSQATPKKQRRQCPGLDQPGHAEHQQQPRRFSYCLYRHNDCIVGTHCKNPQPPSQARENFRGTTRRHDPGLLYDRHEACECTRRRVL